MSEPAWFYAPILPAVGGVIQLAREEAKHALGSKRLGASDVVMIFDGRGGAALARLFGPRDRDGSIAVQALSLSLQPQPKPSVTIATAVPKGDHWSALLDMSAQLGARAIVPIDCERSALRGSTINRPRAERILLEACKQARRPWIPRIDSAVSLRECALAAAVRGANLFLLHPYGESVAGGAALQNEARRTIAPDRADEATEQRELVILIGPEGGFTDAEVASAMASGATRISLGDGILRIETAVAAALALARIP